MEKTNTLLKADLEYRIILLGNTAVGKTCLFKKLTVGTYKEKNVSTIGIDKRTFELKCELEDKDGKTKTKRVQICLTDTAGEERYKALTRSYYKSSDAAIILYDITDKNSYDSIDEWIQSINNSAANLDRSTYTIFLMGTKIDLVESGVKERDVLEEDAIDKCEENKLEWGGEISNKEFTVEQIEKIFEGFIKKMYKKLGVSKSQQESLKLANFKNKKKKKFC